MRRAAPLILLGFVAISATVGWTYYVRLKQQAANTPVKPRKLAPGQTATFHGWTYSHTSSEKTVITIHSDDFQELDGKDELTGVTLDIHNKERQIRPREVPPRPSSTSARESSTRRAKWRSL